MIKLEWEFYPLFDIWKGKTVFKTFVHYVINKQKTDLEKEFYSLSKILLKTDFITFDVVSLGTDLDIEKLKTIAESDYNDLLDQIKL